MRIGFSPRKAALSLCLSNFEGRQALQDKMRKHKQGKGCLYINKLADVDMSILEDIAARSLAESESRHSDD